MSQSKLAAFAFGSDGCSGDSSFWPTMAEGLPADESSSFESLCETWLAAQARSPDHRGPGQAANCGEDPEEAPSGFWLLDERGLEIMQLLEESMDVPDSDSGAYLANRTFKQMCSRLAVRTVQKH